MFITCVGTFLNRVGLYTQFYLDDGAHQMSEVPGALLIQQQFLTRLYNALRLPMNAKESTIMNPSTLHRWIGYLINTQTMEVRLPTDKLERILKNLINLREKSETNCRELASVKGQLQSARFAVKSIHLLIVNIKHTLAEHLRRSVEEEWDPWMDEHTINVESDVKTECEFLIKWMKTLNGCKLHHSHYDYELVIDASDAIMAGFSENHTNHAVMPGNLRTQSSTVREMIGGLSATHSQASDFRNKTVRITTDSISATYIMNFGRVRKHTVAPIAQAIALLAIQHNINLWWQWRRRETKEITMADKLSKSPVSCDWTLNPSVIATCAARLKWPQITLDLCASAKNKQCPRYCSRTFDGASDFVDIFDPHTIRAIDWTSEVCFVNPPYDRKFIARLLTLLNNNASQVIMCLSCWDNDQWESTVRRRAIDHIFLPRNKNLFFCTEFFDFRKISTPTWDSQLVLLNFRDSKPHTETSQYKWSWSSHELLRSHDEATDAATAGDQSSESTKRVGKRKKRKRHSDDRSPTVVAGPRLQRESADMDQSSSLDGTGLETRSVKRARTEREHA